jgi:2-keto-4-pentenoate hydratase/2-oxohepta-3-ene-1,7-dioic acid hydratase in catechol pathway
MMLMQKAARWVLVVAVAVVALAASVAAQQTVTRYVRYQAGNTISYGILDGETVRELQGSIFENARPTGRTRKLAEVKLVAPVEPKKVIAAGFNYKSHLGEQPAAKYIGLFLKLPSSIIGHEENILYPADATDLHYESEVVVVIGRRARNITEAQVAQHIFGITAGNDVSERAWQKQDLQWFRAKASDTFGPIGPSIATGLDYNNLKLVGRHNGKVVQETNTNLLIFSIPYIVSYVSRYVTLDPGDVIFTGTPGTTYAMKPGDTFEVEVDGVGVLRNRVVAAPAPGAGRQ